MSADEKIKVNLGCDAKLERAEEALRRLEKQQSRPVLSRAFWRALELYLRESFFTAIRLRCRSSDYNRTAKQIAKWAVDQIAELAEKHGLSDEFWDSVMWEAQEHD